MSAAGLLAIPKNVTGLYPVNLRRDLPAIVDLIEVCFAPTLDAGGRAALDDMRALSRTGPLLWLLARVDHSLPLLRGFVWFEAGRLVGNVTVTPANFDRNWVISNVAVEPAYRRRGIARRLMTAALDFAAQKHGGALLQVDADNPSARALYTSLGFQEQRLFTHWRRPGYYRPPSLPPDAPVLRRLTRADSANAARVLALAEAARPNHLGGLGWLRPTRPQALRPPRLVDLRYALSGSRSDVWYLPGSGERSDGALCIESRLGGVTRTFDLLVNPASGGALDSLLLTVALNQIADRRRALVTEHPDDDNAGVEVLRAHDFRPERTLVHMIRPAD